MSTPTTLKSGEFEQALLDAAKRADGITMSRYGVMGSMINGQWTAVPSLPDFEGVFGCGRQFIIEAKVCSQSSLHLNPKILKERQVSHMLERSSYGVPCFVVIHFTERRGKNFHDPAETMAIPVHAGIMLWTAFVDECRAAKRESRKFVSPGSINREMADAIGTRILWKTPPRCRKPLPVIEEILNDEMTSPHPKPKDHE